MYTQKSVFIFSYIYLFINIIKLSIVFPVSLQLLLERLLRSMRI